MANDKSELARLSAIEELENIQSRWDLSKLLSSLNDESPFVRGDAAIVLSLSNSLIAKKYILKASKKEKDPEASIRFLLALYKLNPGSVSRKIIGMTSHPHYRVRILSTRSWARICNKKDGRLLFKLLKQREKVQEVKSVECAISDAFHILHERFGYLK